MKYLRYLAAVTLLCGVSAVSYWFGYSKNDSKNYEAACLQADFIRYLQDHFDGETECVNIGSEIEECYYEYFSDVENYGTSIKSVKEFDDYGWCY